MKEMDIKTIKPAAQQAGTNPTKMRRLDPILNPIKLNERGDRGYTPRMITLAKAVIATEK